MRRGVGRSTFNIQRHLGEQSDPARERVPTHLAERILAARDQIEGERKQVTVLFADIKGSTELIEGLDPEAAKALLEPAVLAMMDAVHRYEGTVNHVLGDGIMALFGAPLALEDHAARACYAALALQGAIGAYGEQVRATQGLEIQARVGLHSGEVVVGTISYDPSTSSGQGLRMEYSAVGSTIHLASRMEQLATPGTIRLTAETVRLVEGLVQVRPLGPIPVRGLTEPVEIFELLGAGPARRRFQAAASRGLTRFVGREAELATLQRALERARAGHGQIVAPVGEPGVGKSRLFYELTHSHRVHDWLVLESGSVSYGQATSWLPVIDLLKAYCHVEPRDDSRTVREKVVGKLLGLDEALRPILPAILTLLDAPVDPSARSGQAAAWQALDPPQRRRQTLDAIKRLLLRESQEQPLLLVFEDLHWIDTETQALLDSLVESLPTARVLLLVNYRPEYQHGWGNKSYYTQLQLDPLPPESAEELLRALLGDDPGLQPLAQLLIKRAEGNPFFLEESVRSLVETRALAGERGAYHLTRPVGEIRVPATVQAILAARIDRLPPEDKRLLQTAAVVGKDVPFPLLRAIVAEAGAANSAPTDAGIEALVAAPDPAHYDDSALWAGLARLQAAEFLYEASLFPEPEHTFKHALTHEVAYGSLLQERRRALHARIVAAIEALYPDRLDEHVERLTHHALRGEAWEEAVAHGRQAGRKAMARSANREAVLYLEQALTALEHLPEGPDTVAQAIDVRLDLRTSLVELGDERGRLGYLREAEDMAEALGDRRRLARVSGILTTEYWLAGEYDRAIEAGQRTVTLGEALGDLPLQNIGNLFLAQPYLTLGEYRLAMRGLRWILARPERDVSEERFDRVLHPRGSALSYLAWILAELGQFGEGAACGEEAVRILEAAERPFLLTIALNHLGHVHLRRGRPRAAIAALERALDTRRRWDLAGNTDGTSVRLGAAYTLAGRVADGLPLLEQVATRDPPQVRPLALLATARIWLAEAYLRGGRVAEARALAERAVNLSAEHKERPHLAWAGLLRGEIAAHPEAPDLERAERSYREALSLAEELGMRPLQAHCHRGLGKLYRRTGRAEEARAELSTGVEMLRAMEMTFWLPEAEAELAVIASPSTTVTG